MLNLEQQIFSQLEKSKNTLVVFASTWEGDSLAAALALYLFLKKLGKTVDIVASKYLVKPGAIYFLPGHTEIKNDLNNLQKFIVSLNISQAKVNQIKYTVDNDQLNFIISPASGWFKPEDVSMRAGDFKYDLVIAVGANDLESLGQIYDDNVEFFYKTTVINIGSQSANEGFGQINLVDINAVADSEILFSLFKNNHPELLDEDIATCLLAGIIQKTRNFKNTNLTPRVLLNTSELIALGARREEIVTHLYRSRSLNSLKLWGKVLNNLKTENNEEFLWSTLNAHDFSDTETGPEDLDNIIEELIAGLPKARVIVILGEEAINQTKMIIYSLKNLNALEFSKEYGSVGTSKRAQAQLALDLPTAIVETIVTLKHRLDKLNS
jgi:phosphoesterase RecJ-like protein